MKTSNENSAHNAALIAAPDLLKENQSLRSELQKQKELNAELVAYVDDLLEDHKNCPWMIDNGHRAESLIKKSKPT